MSAKSTGIHLADAGTWKARLRRLVKHAERGPVVFIVGSGLSWARRSEGQPGVGVWDVPTMVVHGQDLLLREQDQDPALADRSGLPTDYQGLMRRLADLDAELPNALVRRGVLAACSAPEAPEVAELWGDEQRQQSLKLQRRSDAWRLPPGVAALAKLIRRIEEVRSKRAPQVRPPAIVTTNFDGLLEIALQREGVPCESREAIVDAWVHNATHAVTVWHVHGSWLGQTTMHSQRALGSRKGELAECLRRCFDGARIVTLAYGAWNDVVFSTISEVFQGSFERAPEITWAFFEGDEHVIAEKYQHVVRAFHGPLADRVTFAKAVNVHHELPEVVRAPRSAAAANDSAGSASTSDGLDGGDDSAGGATNPSPGAEAGGSDSGGEPAAAAGKTKSHGPEDWPPEAALRELLAQTPEWARAELQTALYPKEGMPDLRIVVAKLCGVLEKLAHGDEQQHYAQLSATVISSLARTVADSVLKREHGAELHVQTPVLAEMLMAHAQRRDLRFRRKGYDIVGSDLVYDECADPPLDAGPHEGDWVATFKQRLWYELFSTDRLPGTDAELLGELERKKLRNEQVYALKNADAKSPINWRQVERSLEDVRLLARSAAPSPLGFNEFTLACLIRDFLKLASEQEKKHG